MGANLLCYGCAARQHTMGLRRVNCCVQCAICHVLYRYAGCVCRWLEHVLAVQCLGHPLTLSHPNLCRSATLMPHLAPYLTTAGAEKVVKAAIERFVQETAPKAVVDDDADTPDLCNCEFTLAYGGKILLKNARLWLKQGRRYGLCGPNGAGKSTLMRAIANGQLDGFPPKDVLRTVYVEHDIDASEAETPAVEFVAKDAEVMEVLGAYKLDEVRAALLAVGFPEELVTVRGARSTVHAWLCVALIASRLCVDSDAHCSAGCHLAPASSLPSPTQQAIQSLHVAA